MCGIIGYIGDREVKSVLISALKRMEYRGYDSSGIAIGTESSKIFFNKKKGKIISLERSLKIPKGVKDYGIGHTRWATHGKPSEKNSHPIFDCNKNFFVAHNGIIENYLSIRKKLEKEGHKFESETDTEVIAHLIESHYKGDFFDAVRLSLEKLWGAYGIVVMSPLHSGVIIAAKKGSPMLIGLGKKEHFIASDTAAFVSYTKKMISLEDGDIAYITKNELKIRNLKNLHVNREKTDIEYDIGNIEKGGYPHYMLKEISLQPETLVDSMRGRIVKDSLKVKLGGLDQARDILKNAKKIIFIACGTSWHSGLVGEYLIEELAKLPVEVEYASEFRYRTPVIEKNDVVIAISQSGETADTLAAIKYAKKMGASVLGICNVVGSSISKETEAGVYTHAGPEIGVASTKAFTSQVVVLILFALYLAEIHNISLKKSDKQKIINDLMSLPVKIKEVLDNSKKIEKIAKKFNKSTNFLYLGRGYNFPVALEGALKLKEISYIHAEGYPAAEMKHGPIALIDKAMPTVFIALKSDPIYSKIISNIQAVRARKGKVIVVAEKGDTEILEHAHHVIYIPKTVKQISPVIAVVPLQLLSYYIAVQRGCDVDQPRNLAKSVTVE